MATSTATKARREGEKVWCPDPRNVWQLGSIVEDDGDSLFVLTPDDNEEHKFNVSQTHPFDPSHSMLLPNVSDMDNLHEAPLLDLLRRRYMEDLIYTFTGDILISINPYKNIPLLYNFPDIGSLSKQENPTPHVYVTADGAYRALQSTGKCQSILVSGESGAGKTEAAKYIMRYLANISQSSKSSHVNGGGSVEQCVLQSNPLLEAFGNAKTIRNDNSSRFGKFIKINYDRDGKICGASTSHFLLEKSRIVGCSENERNYHIFYQICSGLTDAERAALHLERADDYVYLNQGHCIQCPEVNDKKCFKELVDAMDVMGISADLKHNIFTLVASVLHLGNLNFVENAKNEATCPDKSQVAVLASLLEVTPRELEFALCMRTVSAGARGSVAEICLSGVDAGKSRNGLAKAIYSALFDWLVDRINVATAQMTGAVPMNDVGASRFIGILDIFGFEILAVNSFEQLCINYTNEMLQQQFNQHVFVYEQDVYVEEGIDWSKLSFQDNIPCLELIEKRPLGILILLDEQALMGRRASDDNFIQKLHQTHEKHANYIRPRFGNEDFIIKHYAGQVTYKVAGFLDKNNDSLHNDLLNLTNSSTMAFLRGLFASSTPPGDQKLKRASMTKMTGTMTVGRKFREQMTELMQQLNTTTPAFVRCVKPNNVRFPQGWNAELILNQLIYLGVMETVRIRRSGFPVRRTFNEFYLKYKLLYNVYAAKTKARPTTVVDKDKCELILTHAVERDNWQLGNKKVFMRDSQLRLLDAAIRKVRVEAAITVQAYVRRFLQRKQYLRVRAAIIQVQANVRMFVARTKFLRLRHRITSFNACVRRWLARRRYLRMKHAAICIQAGERGRKARMLAKYLRAAPKAQTVIAKHFRGYLARKYVAKLKQSGFIVKASVQTYVTRQRFLRLRHAAIAISKSAKRFLAVQRYRRQRQAAIIIHAVGRGFLARLKYGKNARLRAHIRSKAQTAISRMVRGYLGRLHYRAALRCIVKVQARWRANRVRTLYIQGRQATIASQAMIRRSLARRKFLREKKMATRLCAFGRMIIARRAYLKAKRQIVLVQSLARRYLQRKHYRHIMRQFVLIQAMWRRHQCVQTYQRQRWAIVQIQSLGKMIPQRRQFHAARQAATAMTACVRMFLARRRYLRARAGFVRLQARWRSVVARRQYISHVGLIVKLQSAIRAKLARKQMQTQRRGLLRVLALMRKYLARIRLHKKIDQMFAAAHAFDLSTILAMAQDKEFPNATMVRVRDKHNHMRSLVHIAALNGDLNLARFVLSEIPGMEDQVIGRDNLGNTPLHYAARLVHLDMVKYLAKIVNRINPSQDSAKHGTSRKSASPANSNNSPVNQGSDMLRKDSSFSQTAPRSPVGTPLWSPSMGANNTPGGKTKRRALVSSASAMPPNPAVLTAVELPPDTTKVLKAGPLRTASGSKMASKRHVVLDEYVLALYKSSTDRIPVKLIELQDVTLRRATTIENCFDILSPRLKCAKDPYGIVSFVADTEAEVHDWMKAIREVPMVRIGTLVPPNPSMICIDWSNRKEWINAKNNQHESALHLAVQNQEDEGFEAVKTAVWLIENDADINAKDHAGNTPLHYAVHEERDDLVESLLKKGALVTVTNNAGQTPLDMADEQSTKDLLAPGAVVSVPTDRFNLLARPKGPHKVKNATYVSVLLSAVAIAGAVMQTPHFRIYVMDVRGNVVDTPQHTPDALIQDGPSLWFGNTWHLQVPLEHMTEGCVAVFELLRYDYHTEKPDVFCWTFFRLDLSKISSAPLTFEMYAPPVNPSSQILAKMLGDSFFQADLSISL